MGIAVVDARSSPKSRISNFDLSVRTLHCNERQSTYHEPDKEKLFHLSFPSSFFVFEGDLTLRGFLRRLEIPCLILSLLFLSSFYCSFFGLKKCFYCPV